MAASFIPLTLNGNSLPKSRPSSGAVSSPLPAPAVASFQPLAELASPTKAATETSASAPAPAAEPSVELQNHDGHISRIRVRCTCGQVHELECLY